MSSTFATRIARPAPSGRAVSAVPVAARAALAPAAPRPANWRFSHLPLSAPRPDPLERQADDLADRIVDTPQADVLDSAEQRLGVDLSGVRLHTGAEAARSAKALSARAYAVGDDIVFGEGEFAPHSASGRRLIAHELSHVAQQRQLGPFVQRDPQVADKAAIEAARQDFRSRHSGHDAQVLDNIDAALQRITAGNPDLLLAYYRFYAHYKLTDDIGRGSKNAGETGSTFFGGPYTDINEGVLALEPLQQFATDDRLSFLGETLIHEYSHTANPTSALKGPGEGKAYGIENFFAERQKDKARDDQTLSLGGRMGDQLAFDTAYHVMKALYAVIDGVPADKRELKGLTPDKARALVTEFIPNTTDDFSEDLTSVVRIVAKQRGLDSLP
jgi:hypothetical protein